MTRNSTILLAVVAILITAVITVSAVNTTQEKTISSPLKVTIGEILEKGDSYGNQTLEITGTITTQCGSGCWFFISDKTGDLYVSLRPNNFVIPPSMGRQATIQGVLALDGTDITFIGSSVQIGGMTFPEVTG